MKKKFALVTATAVTALLLFVVEKMGTVPKLRS